jgi:hypothetical protein
MGFKHRGTPATEKPKAKASGWMSRPDQVAVQEQIDQFFRAVAAGDFRGAFSLCPQVASDADTEAVMEHMKGEMVGWDYVPPEDAEHWYRHITPPADVAYEGVNLAMPDNEGEVLANVIVDRQATDLTAFFNLTKQGDHWGLRFRMFHVM